MNRGRGWRGEPIRHSLSSKGIRTTEFYAELNNMLGIKLSNIGIKTGVGDIRFGDVFQLDEILKKVSEERNKENELGLALLPINDYDLLVYDVIRGDETTVRNMAPRKEHITIHTHPGNEIWSVGDIGSVINTPYTVKSFIVSEDVLWTLYSLKNPDYEVSSDEIDKIKSNAGEVLSDGSYEPHEIAELFNETPLGEYIGFEGEKI